MPAVPRIRVRPRRVSPVAALLLYLSLALWATWPLARSATDTLPLGPSQSATVPLFNLWTIWWNADRALHGWREYWDAPIFFPTVGTFAFSEPQPLTVLVAPVIWLTGSRALAYNIYLWLSLALNGIFAERLLRASGVRGAVAIGGGAAMVLLPIAHWQLEVLQLVPLWGILWSWLAIRHVARKPTVVRGAELGLALGVTFLLCVHHGLFLMLVLIGAAPVFWKQMRQPRWWLACLTAAVVAGVLVGPIVLPLRRAVAAHQFTRAPEIVSQLSARPGDYLVSPGKHWFNFGFAGRPFWRLSPGWIKVALALVGLAVGMSSRRRRGWTAFLFIMGVLALLLSLGTNLRIGDWQPWWTLTDVCPGLRQVRNVFRFAFFAQMTVVLLAAQGIWCLDLFRRRVLQSARWRFVAGWLLALVGLAALFETSPAATHLATVPDAAANSRWIEFVRTRTPPGRAVICLPMAQGDRAEDYEGTTRWMYFGTFHGVPLVNGYSGFFPEEFFALQDAVNESFPSEDTLRRLADLSVEFVVVRRAALPKAALHSTRFETVFLERVLEDANGVDVYRVRRGK